MEITSLINGIESRANALNLGLWDLCKKADIDYRRVERWRRRNTAQSRLIKTTVAKLEATLDRLEREVYDAIRPRVEQSGNQKSEGDEDTPLAGGEFGAARRSASKELAA